jgi:hypothetical protein
MWYFDINNILGFPQILVLEKDFPPGKQRSEEQVVSEVIGQNKLGIVC